MQTCSSKKQRRLITNSFSEAITSEDGKPAGLSSTIYKIFSEKKKIDSVKCSKYTSPRKHINIPKRVTAIDDTDKEVLTRLILNVHETERTVPKVKHILPKFKDVSGFKGCLESLRKTMQSREALFFLWMKRTSMPHIRQPKVKMLIIYIYGGLKEKEKIGDDNSERWQQQWFYSQFN